MRRIVCLMLVLVLCAAAGAAGVAAAQDLGRLLPGGRLDSLRVTYSDPRGRESYPVYAGENETSYLALADIVRVANTGLTWDPETYRGSFRLDSLQVAFTLDSSVLWISGRAVQISGPIRYAEQTLCAPLDLLESVVLPSLGDRARFDAGAGRLEVGGPRPWLGAIELSSLGNRVTVTISPVTTEPHVVSWDPVGEISVLLRGLHVSPGYVPPTSKTRGIERIRVVPTSDGIDVRLVTDSGWTAARARRSTAEKRLQVELSRSPRDVSLPGFRRLGSYPHAPTRARFGQPRRVLLEMAGSDAVGGAGAVFLENLAQALQATLEADFGHEVVRVPDREAGARTEVGPAPPGDCWLGLRLETYAAVGESEFLLVVPGGAPRWDEAGIGDAQQAEGTGEENKDEETMGAGAEAERSATGLAADRAVPWGQVARVEARRSESLARSLRDHLRAELGGRAVSIWPRPARVFRGLSMPAALLYPARASDGASLAEFGDPEALLRLARTIAFGLDEFLISHGDAP